VKCFNKNRGLLLFDARLTIVVMFMTMVIFASMLLEETPYVLASSCWTGSLRWIQYQWSNQKQKESSFALSIDANPIRMQMYACWAYTQITKRTQYMIGRYRP